MDYPTRTRTGDAVLDRLVLTGWGTVTSDVTSLFTWTDGGRLWWTYVASTRVLTFYRRKTALSGDAVCSVTITTAGIGASIAASNSSGITGSCEMTNGDYSGALVSPTQDSTGDCIICYCDENDLRDAAIGVNGVLDTNSKWYGQLVRWEALLLRSMSDFGNYVQQRIETKVGRDFNNKPRLADIMEPRQLAKSYATYIVAELMEHRQGTDPVRIAATESKRARAMNLLNSLDIALDLGADRVADATANMSSARLILA